MATAFSLAQAQSWVYQDRTPRQWDKTLAAQRAEIEEVKRIFARIDARLVQIESIHREIENILENPDAVIACVTLGEVRKTQAQLKIDYHAASSGSERARLNHELRIFDAMYQRAEKAADRLECRE